MSSLSRPQEVRPTVLMVGDAEPMALRLRTAMSWHGLALAEAVGPAAIQAIHLAVPDMIFLVGDVVKDGGDKILELFAQDPTASRMRVAILSDDIGLMSRDRGFGRVIGVVPRSGSSDAIGRRVAELAREAKTARENESAPMPAKVDTRLTEIDALKSVRAEMETSNTGEFMIVEPVASKRSSLEPEVPSKQNLTWQDSAPTRVAPELAEQNLSVPAPEIVTKEISIDDEAFEDLSSSPPPPEREETRSVESLASVPPPPPPQSKEGRPDSKRLPQRTLLGFSDAPPAAPAIPSAPTGVTRETTLLGLPSVAPDANSSSERREPSRSVSLPLTAKQSLAKKTMLGMHESPINPAVPAPPPWPPPEPRLSERAEPSTPLETAASTMGGNAFGKPASQPFVVAPPESTLQAPLPPKPVAQAPAKAASTSKAFRWALVIVGGALVVVALVVGIYYIAPQKSQPVPVPEIVATPEAPPASPVPPPAADVVAVAEPAPPVVEPPPVAAEPAQDEPAQAEPVPAEPIVAAEPAAPPVAEEPAQAAAAAPTTGLSGDSLCRLGDTAQDAHDYAAAANYYRQALNADPGNPHAYVGLAHVSLRAGTRADALAYAQHAVQVRPRRAAYRILLGDVYQAMGDRAHARAAWEEALRLEPRNREATRRLH